MIKVIEDEAVDILEAIWLAIDWSKYNQGIIRRIYSYYASRIRSAATTSSDFSIFLESLAKKMSSDLTEVVMIRLEVDRERLILHAFREESRYLVASFRERLENKKKGGR